MSEPLRYIIVGTGGFGGYWCATVLPRLAEMGKAVAAAAADVNPAALANAQHHLKLPPEKCYTDVKEAFDKTRADFAIVVVPPAHHEKVVDLALAHDMHILSEKPIADPMKACTRIYKKVHAAGKKMAVTMSHRFDQDKQSLAAAIKSGKYGPRPGMRPCQRCSERARARAGHLRPAAGRVSAAPQGTPRSLPPAGSIPTLSSSSPPAARFSPLPRTRTTLPLAGSSPRRATDPKSA